MLAAVWPRAVGEVGATDMSQSPRRVRKHLPWVCEHCAVTDDTARFPRGWAKTGKTKFPQLSRTNVACYCPECVHVEAWEPPVFIQKIRALSQTERRLLREEVERSLTAVLMPMLEQMWKMGYESAKKESDKP
jgi:hypothetical protein